MSPSRPQCCYENVVVSINVVVAIIHLLYGPRVHILIFATRTYLSIKYNVNELDLVKFRLKIDKNKKIKNVKRCLRLKTCHKSK